MAPERDIRPQFPPVYTGGHRLRAHQPRGRQEDRFAAIADHTRKNIVQAHHSRHRVRPIRHDVSDAELGDASPQR